MSGPWLHSVVRGSPLNKGAHKELSVGTWEARGIPGSQELEPLASVD